MAKKKTVKKTVEPTADDVVAGLNRPVELLKEFEQAMSAEPLNRNNAPLSQILQMYKVQKESIKAWCEQLEQKARR